MILLDSTFVITQAPTYPWGSILGSIISGLIALGIFILGQYFENRKTKKRKKNDQKILEEYLYLQVTDLYTSGIKKSLALVKFIRELNQEKERDFHFPAISSFNPKNLASKDNEQLFSNLVLNRSGNQIDSAKNYSEFIKCLLLLSNIKGLLYDWFQDLNLKYQTYIHEYKEHLEKVVRTMEDFGTVAEQKGMNLNDDVFLSRYVLILQELISDQEYKDIHKSYSKLILPMHKLCSDKEIVRADPRANIILKELMQAKYCFENYLNLKNTYIKEYCKQARKINTNVILIRKYFISLKLNDLK